MDQVLAAVGFLVSMVVGVFLILWIVYATITIKTAAQVIDLKDWECTQEAVIDSALPKKYQCTQWTRKAS